MAKKITLSGVVKKDVRVLTYLVVFGGVSYIMQRFVTDDPAVSLVAGAAANYLLFRIRQELEKEGYREALKQ